MRSMSNQYMCAQSEATISLAYNADVYNLIKDSENDILVVIQREQAATLGFSTLGSTRLNGGKRLFSGHAPLSFNRKYNGIMDNTIITLNATDSADLLDVPCGDVVYRNDGPTTYYLSNPYDKAHSIIHLLAGIAGFPQDRISDVYIPIVHPCIAPTDEEQTVYAVLDSVLHEYGYVLHFDEYDDIHPIKWIYTDTDTASCTFSDTDRNVYDTFAEQRNVRDYLGLELTYYPIGTKTNVLVYRDSELPYASDGSFLGYAIPTHTYYPPATNVIDETTGNPQLVYQEYTDNGINYLTNKAVVNNLDINRNAVSSDYSSMIATFNHNVVYRANSGITVDHSETGNKKARIRFYNSNATSADLDYLNIYASVIYKASKRISKSYTGVAPRKLAKYEAMFICEDSVAKTYTERRAAQYARATSVYTLSSDRECAVGALVKIVLNDGTDVFGLILDKTTNIVEDRFDYTIIKYDVADYVLTSQAVNSISTPANMNPVYIARYLGKSATVPAGINEGDWFMPTINIEV
jgi:hypothetical protein